jgi:hypothetical protein
MAKCAAQDRRQRPRQTPATVGRFNPYSAQMAGSRTPGEGLCFEEAGNLHVRALWTADESDQAAAGRLTIGVGIPTHIAIVSG